MLRNPIDEATRPSSEQVERRVRADTSFIAQLHDTGPKVASANNRMRLSEVIGALSYALDLTEGQPAGHSLRCTWIGMHVGQALALTADQLSDLYYTLLLKDAGCSSNAARLWELYGGDERLVKHDYKTVDSQSLFALGQFVLQHTGPGEPLRRRVQRLFNLARDGDELADELIQTRCERGANIVLQLGFNEPVAAGVYCAGRALERQRTTVETAGRGNPAQCPHRAAGAGGRRIPWGGWSAGGAGRRCGAGPAPGSTQRWSRRSEWPRGCGFWVGLDDDGLDARVAAMEPVARAILIDEDRLDVIAEAFADIIDAKSSFTAGHSRRVTHYADAVAISA